MKIIVKTIAGSHLFGLNTENSDKDFKGIYLPDGDEILLGNYADVRSQSTGDDKSKNTKDDVDVEFYSLRKFMKMIENGDTAAIELLFTPDSHIIQSSYEWRIIQKYRNNLISKKITALIGYARQQAAKYGVRSSRLGDLESIKNFLKEKEKETFLGAKLFHVFEQVKEFQKDLRFVNLITLNISKDKTIDGIDILGKKYDINTPLSSLTKKLSDDWKSYGQRAREARNNEGIDYKACSHAVRCCIQGIELMNTGQITLPHTGENQKLLMDIKTGKYSFKELEELMDFSLRKLELARDKSTLSETPSSLHVFQLIRDLHLLSILEKYN